MPRVQSSAADLPPTARKDTLAGSLQVYQPSTSSPLVLSSWSAVPFKAASNCSIVNACRGEGPARECCTAFPSNSRSSPHPRPFLAS